MPVVEQKKITDARKIEDRCIVQPIRALDLGKLMFALFVCLRKTDNDVVAMPSRYWPSSILLTISSH